MCEKENIERKYVGREIMKEGFWKAREWVKIYGKVKFKLKGMVSEGLKDNILDERYSKKKILEQENLNTMYV